LEDFEILTAASILIEAGAANPGASFQNIELKEPSKDFVLGFQQGEAIPRSATVFYRQDRRSFRTAVDLISGEFTRPELIPRRDGQLGLTIGEIFDFEFLFQDPTFLDALMRRGIDTAEELANVFVTPLTPGSFGLPEESRRIVKAQMYDIGGASINLYARPIEGIQAIVDLDDQVVIDVLDSGVVAVPTDNHTFDEATIDARYGLRDELRPFCASQPEGPNFTLENNFVEWQKWRFHVRFDRRAGTMISLVTYDGRSIMYQGSLAEVFVPYQDPTVNWFYRTFMDEGEFGFGLLASPLALGLDLPANAVLLDAVISAAIPDPDVPVVPLPLEDVVGIFERSTGNPIWRHFELFSPGGPSYEGRAEVELVVRMISQVGNYDYIVDWVFTQAGSIRVEVSLTGIDVPKGVESRHLDDHSARSDTAFGTLVAPNLVATYHSHHFNFRLDMDVDGPKNNFVLGRLKSVKAGRKSPRKSIWTVENRLLRRERMAALDDEESVWRVESAHDKNALGYSTSYVLESGGNGEPLLDPEDFRRAGFIEHDLWVTAFDADERFAAGDTPNQNPGRPGLPRYIANNENIAHADIVLWHTVTFHHVTAAEDFPVLPRESASFELVPANFFDRNPAIDLRRAPFEVLPEP
jgi:primary-amine oxidase